ncbi:hypothetical protein ACFLQ6_05165, partial [Thermoproteota archaeon]
MVLIMICIKISRFLFIIFTIVLLTSNIAHIIPNVSAIGVYTSIAPTIDGVIGDIEWQNAETLDINYGEHDGFNFVAKAYIMNDLDNIYMAFEIDDPVPNISRFTVLFDDNDDGIYDDAAQFEQAISEYSDRDHNLNPDAHLDGEMTSTFGAGKNYFELSKPLNSGDMDDIDTDLLQKLKFFTFYRTGTLAGVESMWTEIDLKPPFNIVILNVRQPDKVRVAQTVFIAVDVKCEFLEETSLPVPLHLYVEIWAPDWGDIFGSDDQMAPENDTITSTFELVAPPAPIEWELRLVVFLGPDYPSALIVDEELITIEVEDDLEITPDVEGICIWDGPPPPETAPPLEQIEIPIEVKYAVTYDAWIVAGIYDEEGTLISSVQFEERVSGIGTNDYIFEVTTPDTEGPWNLKASLYYGHVIGVDSVHEECDEWPFTLIITSGVPGGEGVKIIDVTSPVEVNSGDEVLVNVNVEYELPAGAKYHASILESTSSLIIKTSDEMTAASHGFETFSFDGIYAPFILTDTIFT